MFRYFNDKLIALHIMAGDSPNEFIASVVVIACSLRLYFLDTAALMTLLIMATIILALAHFFGARVVSPTAKNVMLFSVIGLVILTILSPDMAHANTIGEWANNIKTSMTAVYNTFIYGSYAGGGTMAAMGITNGIKKTKGDQQVTTASIFGYGLGGPALAMVGYYTDSAAESVGGGASNMNTAA